MIKVAINGFGRIGRVAARIIQDKKNMELVAINDLTDANTLAHLFKYDSVHGKFKGTVVVAGNDLIINEKKVKITAERDPENLPWKNLDVDVVIESTGIFKTTALASKHLKAGAKKVIISAPAKGEKLTTIVVGINDKEIVNSETIYSNASCTTNASAPLIKVLNDLCDIEHVFLTTVHSYTNDQGLHDSPHTDLRRARGGAQSIVPTSTGAANAIVNIFPQLKNKIQGYAVRVPVPDGSLIDICATVNKLLSVEEINKAFEKASKNELKGVLSYTSDPIVSVDIIGNPHSCIFDSQLTAVNGNMIKIVGWYDNESGYSNRLVDLIEKIIP